MQTIPDDIQAHIDKKLSDAIDELNRKMQNSPYIAEIMKAQHQLYTGEITPAEELEMLRYAETLPRFGE